LNQIKSNKIRLLATAPLIRSTGAQVQAYNYNANTITIMGPPWLRIVKEQEPGACLQRSR